MLYFCTPKNDNMKYYLVFLILLLSSVSCTSTKYVTKEVPIEIIKEVPVEIYKTEYIHTNRIDSVIIKDSIDRSVVGDTVYISRNRLEQIKSNQRDTIIITDTLTKIIEIEVPKPITETVVQEVNVLHWYQKILMFLGVLLLGYVGIKFFSKI